MIAIKRVHAFFLFGAIAAVTVGMGCHETGTNELHCWNANGNATCEEAFGADVQWYCSTDALPCGVDAPLGCVTERPMLDQCYSPCGGGKSALDGEDCFSTGDGDGDDPAPGRCGDGMLDDGEACDLGEANGGDECNAVCELARCGDGYVQVGRGEECDDGGLLPGDACTVDCLFPGAALAQSASLEDFLDDFAVGVDADGHVFVASRTENAMKLAKFESDLLAPLWIADSLLTSRANLVIGETGDPITGGHFIGDSRAAVRRTNPMGGEKQWATAVGVDDASDIVAVAAAEGQLVAAGYRGNEDSGILAWIDAETGTPTTIEHDTPLGAVAVEQSGRVWALGRGIDPELLMFPVGAEAETFALDPGSYEDVVGGVDGLYLLANVDGEGIVVSKLDFDGARVWTSQAYAGASAKAIALIPGGAVIVAGAMLDAKSGLLVWYDPESGEQIHHVDRRTKAGAVAMFEDVAVAPSGEFAVAVGGTGPDEDSTHLWIYEFTI